MILGAEGPTRFAIRIRPSIAAYHSGGVFPTYPDEKSTASLAANLPVAPSSGALFVVGRPGTKENTGRTKPLNVQNRRQIVLGAEMDNSFLEEQAARCRKLAERTDP